MTSNHRNQVRDFIQLLFDPGESFYTKTGQVSFQYNEVLKDGELRLRPTHLSNESGLVGREHSETRHLEITAHDGIDYLSNPPNPPCEGGRRGDGGVFFVGAINPEYPLKDYCRTTRDIVAEMDNGTTEEQWAKIRTQEKNTGLPFSVVSSGNKSLHAHLTTDPPLPYDKNIYYRRLLVLLFDSDPAVARHHQPVRLPGFLRKETGNYQELLQLGERIDEQTLRSGLKKAFEANNWRFPESIPDDWWAVLRKSHTLQADLEMGYERWKEYQQKEEEERHKRWLEYKSSINVIDEFDTRELILSALDAIPRRIPNTGSYEDYRRLACALKNELGETEAIYLMERHSPSSYCGWNVEQVIRSSTGKYNAGTIFNFAKEFGWSFPKRHYEFQEYYKGEKVVLSGEAALKKAKENVEKRQEESFADWVLRTLKGLSKGFRRGFKNYGDFKVEPPEKIIYRPDMPAPKPSDYEGKKPPLIVIPVKYAQYRAKIFAQLIGAGWELIHDQSFMGDGKTHSIHQLGNQYIYLCKDYRNPPTTELAEDALPIPSRHSGLYEQNGRLTTNPNWKDDINLPLKVAPSNCLYAKEYNKLRDKGYPIDDDKALCNHVVCPFRYKCHKETGENYGFLQQRKEALAALVGTEGGLNGRAFPSQLPSPQKPENTFPHERITLIWDEISQLSFTDSLSISQRDYNDVTARILAKLPHIASLILPKITLLYELLSGEAYQVYCDFKKEKVPRFLGIDSVELREMLGEPPIELIDNFERYKQELTDLLSFEPVKPNSVTAADNGGKWETDWERRCAATARREFKRQAVEANQAKVDSASTFWLVPFLQIWCGLLNGTISYQAKSNLITIKKLNEKYAHLAQGSKANVILDTTGDPILVRKLLGIEESHCIQVMQSNPVLKNLKVLNIEQQGMKSLNWSPACLGRLKIALQAIYKQYGEENVCVIGPKKYADQLGYSHWWGRDERGQNQFAGKKVVVYLGTPYTNLQEAKDDYRLIFGTDEGFEQYYHRLVYSALFQGSGRTRVQRFPDREFLQIFIGTGQDFSFLRDYGAEVFDLDMVEVCPEAAPRSHRDFANALKLIRHMIKLGTKVTQETVARGLNCSQGWVSRLFATAPTLKWREILPLLHSVFKPHKRDCNNFDVPPEERLLNDLEATPLKTFRGFLDGYDGDAGEMLISIALPIEVRILLLAICFPGFSDATWDFFNDYCIPF